MEKLELKHLAGYLPYELKFIESSIGYVKEMIGMDNSIVYFKEDMGNFFSEVKPILRPLSDLTKEIEHNGEKFVPIEKLECEGVDLGTGILGIQIDKFTGYDFIWLIDIQTEIIEKLYEWHFAINIPEHLYIDKNTI